MAAMIRAARPDHNKKEAGPRAWRSPVSSARCRGLEPGGDSPADQPRITPWPAPVLFRGGETLVPGEQRPRRPVCGETESCQAGLADGRAVVVDQIAIHPGAGTQQAPVEGSLQRDRPDVAGAVPLRHRESEAGGRLDLLAVIAEADARHLVGARLEQPGELAVAADVTDDGRRAAGRGQVQRGGAGKITVAEVRGM